MHSRMKSIRPTCSSHWHVLLLILFIPSNGWADDTARVAALLAPANTSGGILTIPAGDYHLDGTNPLMLSSNTTIFAYGARFHLPETLPDKARVVLFAGSNVSHFAWHGGEFIGQVFDPAKNVNTWEPNANTKCIELTTLRADGTHDVLFRDVKANGIAGAVIGIHGLATKGSESEVNAWAERVVLENCTLLRSGKFMWDYGYLWQIVTWPEAYEPWEVERAKRYFRTDLMRENVTMRAGETQVRFDNHLNTFRNGGRGAWINQPVNFIMTGNVFVNNTTKNESDLRRGRIAFQSAKPGQFPELYFTIYESTATYGPVIVRDNIFILGESAPNEVVTFAPNGHDIQFTGNTFRTKPATIIVDPSCKNAIIENNQGASTVVKPVDFNHGRR